MVRIKHTTRPIIVSSPSEIAPMALDEALETSSQQREASMEATSSCSADSDRESQSGDSADSEIASDNSGCLKVVMAAAATGITYDFGASGVRKAHIGSIENHTCFPRDMAEPLARSRCRSPAQTKLFYSKTFLLLGSACLPIWYLQTFFVCFEFSYTI
jgi:hypothetical protein